MPKIEVDEKELFSRIGKRIPDDRLEAALNVAKAELDGREDGTLKIELNDTNRPDLWSTAGLARQLRVHLGGAAPKFAFFSKRGAALDAGGRFIDVDPALAGVRPFIAGFAATGKALTEPELKDLIQTQEKLCWNYGRKRQSIAMGVYRHDRMNYPVRYTAADPGTTRFVPLGLDRELSLAQILDEHPKGRDFGWIVKDFPRFPFLTDARGEVLSFPPVINSAHLGAVQVGDTELFIELTGTDIDSLLLAASIVACDLHDSGYAILPVATRYPFDTKYGREIVVPYYFQEPQSVDVDYANHLLGSDLSVQDAASAVASMGCTVAVKGRSLTVTVPEYRNDYLHPVDIVEDIMMGRGVETFEPIPPSDFTVGRLTEAEMFSRRVKDTLVGLGYQEMIFNYLGSGRDFIDRMRVSGTDMVKIANPMSENYEYVRASVLPSLLAGESVSAHAAFPHVVFEVGKIAFLDERDPSGTTTRNALGCLYADRDAGFNLIRAHVAALLFYLSCEHRLVETDDPRFIAGRCARIVAGDRTVGILGEVHPAVLDNWGIQMPCAACELDLDETRAAING